MEEVLDYTQRPTLGNMCERASANVPEAHSVVVVTLTKSFPTNRSLSYFGVPARHG